MEAIIEYTTHHIAYAPYIIFGLLLLAGLCLPVSEDAMLFISGLLASQNPDYVIPLFLGVYAGAYLSDLIAYWLGRFLGKEFDRFTFIHRLVSREKIHLMHKYFERHGVLTLIIGRFVPFGFRNAMFLSAGISRMHFLKFAGADWVACTISTSVFFPLYYFLGEPVVEWVKKGNIVIFGLFAIVISAIYLRNRKNK